jgi:predicted alpha/beta hydrolase
LSALALARHPDKVSGALLINVSVVNEQLWPWPQRAAVGLAFRLMPALGLAFGHLPRRPLGLGARIPRQLILDWGRWGRTGHYTSAHLNLAAILATGRGPVLSIGASDDALYAPEPAVRAYLAMMPQAQAECMMVSPHEMNAPALGHFGLLKPPATETLAGRMAQWMEQEAAA